MGVPGLLKALKSVTDASNLSEYRGQCAGVDAYSWLHRGVYHFAVQLAKGEKTTGWASILQDRHIQYALDRVRLLLNNGIKPLLVFDGASLPAKEESSKERRRIRHENKEKGLKLLRENRETEARQYLGKAQPVTHEIAYQLILELKKLSVPFIVAPYEADAQLAFLSRCGHVDFVISEDSDCIPYGCKTVLFKLDMQGNGQVIRRRNLSANEELDLNRWTDDMIISMCILAGCDYCPSIYGLGIKGAHRLVNLHKTNDKVLKALRFVKNIKLPQNFERDFQRAFLTFKHQRVFDPRTSKLMHLSPLPPEIKETSAAFLGRYLSDYVVFSVATARLNPHTLEPCHDPETDVEAGRQNELCLPQSQEETIMKSVPLDAPTVREDDVFDTAPRLILPSSSCTEIVDNNGSVVERKQAPNFRLPHGGGENLRPLSTKSGRSGASQLRIKTSGRALIVGTKSPASDCRQDEKRKKLQTREIDGFKVVQFGRSRGKHSTGRASRAIHKSSGKVSLHLPRVGSCGESSEAEGRTPPRGTGIIKVETANLASTSAHFTCANGPPAVEDIEAYGKQKHNAFPFRHFDNAAYTPTATPCLSVDPNSNRDWIAEKIIEEQKAVLSGMESWNWILDDKDLCDDVSGILLKRPPPLYSSSIGRTRNDLGMDEEMTSPLSTKSSCPSSTKRSCPVSCADSLSEIQKPVPQESRGQDVDSQSVKRKITASESRTSSEKVKGQISTVIAVPLSRCTSGSKTVSNLDLCKMLRCERRADRHFRKRIRTAAVLPLNRRTSRRKLPTTAGAGSPRAPHHVLRGEKRISTSRSKSSVAGQRIEMPRKLMEKPTAHDAYSTSPMKDDLRSQAEYVFHSTDTSTTDGIAQRSAVKDGETLVRPEVQQTTTIGKAVASTEHVNMNGIDAGESTSMEACSWKFARSPSVERFITAETCADAGGSPHTFPHETLSISVWQKDPRTEQPCRVGGGLRPQSKNKVLPHDGNAPSSGIHSSLRSFFFDLGKRHISLPESDLRLPEPPPADADVSGGRSSGRSASRRLALD